VCADDSIAKMKEADQLTLEIQPENERHFGPCACCGNMTTRVWGYVHRGDQSSFVYYVEWTSGHEASQANFDIILGKWGEGTSASDRQAAALEFRKLESGPAFRVIDASLRPYAPSDIASTPLTRAEVIGTPLADEIFAMCDLIHVEDPRIAELR
jgi:hypothetical protein